MENFITADSPDRKKKKVFLILFFVLLIAVFCGVKYAQVGFVTRLFENENWSLLNKLAASGDNQSLDFYIGRSEEIFFGPLAQIISGLSFAVFALLFLQKRKLFFFWLSVFGYLVLTKLEVLFFPPYGDAIGGPFAEAIWLSRHSFDYAGLLKAPSYALGGPQVYVFSIYPTYLAVLLKLIPFPKVFFFINHVIVFAFAATIASLLKDVVSRVYEEKFGVIAAILLVSLPAFQAQTEAINMEMPCTFFVMLSAYFLIQRRFSASGIMAILAALVKGSGVLSCGAFLLIAAYLFFFSKEFKFKKSLLFWGLGLGAFAFLKVGFKFFLNDQHVSAGMVALGKGWPSLNHMYIFYFFVVSLAVFLGFLIFGSLKGNLKKEGMYERAVMLVYGAMWFLLFFNFYAVSPRYRVVSYPFVVFALLVAFFLIVRKSWARMAGLLLALAVALFSSYGYFYGALPGNYHVLLERSLEYRNDLKVNQKLAKTIEENFSKVRIGAPFVIAQILALPELGYTKKDLDVMIYGFECTYGGIKNYPGLANLDIPSTVYVAAQVDHGPDNLTYPIHKDYDKIIKVVEHGDKKSWLFMGGVGIERVFSVTQMFKLRQKRSQKR